MVTSDTHEALSGCNNLGGISVMLVASCIPFPFFVPCNDMLVMLFCATHWLYVHLYSHVYMFMHESCLLVCRPWFNTMRLWTFDLNLHLSLTNTTFCLLSCLFTLCLLFVILLVYPFAHMFACILYAMLDKAYLINYLNSERERERANDVSRLMVSIKNTTNDEWC